MMRLTRAGRSSFVSSGRRLLLGVFLLGPLSLTGQSTNPQPAQKASEPTTESQSAASEPAKNSIPQAPPTIGSSSEPAEKGELGHKAQPFKFTKVDLELLKQADAFDIYIEERGWVYSDPETNGYLEKLGLSLVPAETPENVKWRFRALRDLEVNAFALPNGTIYVNSGLLSRMENEAQLAGVLTHEVAHVVNRHGYLEHRSARKKIVAIDIILTAARAADYAGVSSAITTAMGNLLPVIVVETVFGYSRELEHEADVHAVNTLYRRRYDLREFSRGFELLRNGPEVDLAKEPVFWASHPKLASRVRYIEDMAAQLQPNATGLLVNGNAYRSGTVNVIRHNAGLAILLGRPRTAVAIAQRLIVEEPNDAENYVLLGDAYRSLGARTPVPESEELTDEAKDATRKRMHKMTLAEYDKALLADPSGPARWQANLDRSEGAFRKALSMDPQNANAHRGLGFLFERNGAPAGAIVQFKKYLELAPNAKDARQIRMRLESLAQSISGAKPQARESQAEGPARVQ
jgi:tetratricopeptide (TPR) repeat protein